jgi:hypothetical protein
MGETVMSIKIHQPRDTVSLSPAAGGRFNTYRYSTLLTVMMTLTSFTAFGVTLPLLPSPPQTYSLPVNYVSVSTTAEFIAAFTSATAEDIVLHDGIYENIGAVSAGAARRIWAQTLGKAVIKFGLGFSVSGCEVHGITFNVDSSSRTTPGAIIDGTVNEAEWAGARVLGYGNIFKSGFNYGPSDFGAEFRLLWDEQNLYVALEVVDDVLKTDGTMEPFHDDELEMFIDFNNTKSAAVNSAEVSHFAARYDGTAMVEVANRLAGVTVQSVSGAGGYTIELKFPWANFSLTPAAGKVIGFDIASNERDYDFREGTRQGFSQLCDSQTSDRLLSDNFQTLARLLPDFGGRIKYREQELSC